MAIQVRIIDGKGNYLNGTGADTSDLTTLATGILDRGCVYREDDFLVTERGSGADMSVDVALGDALVPNSSFAAGSLDETRFWPVASDATENVTIAANSSGNPRIDIIVITVDSVTPPDEEATTVVDVTVVQGTPAGSPAAPATPSNSLKIAEVAVANGASSILDANITDTRYFISLRSHKGRLILGSSTEGSEADDPVIRIVSDDYDLTAGVPAMIIEGGSNNDRIHLKTYGVVSAPSFQGVMGRGTLAAPTATQSGDNLVQLRGDGIDNTGAETGSQGAVVIEASENFTTTAQGTRIVLSNTAATTTTLVEAAHIYRGSGGALNVEAQGNYIDLTPGSDGYTVLFSRTPNRNYSSNTYTRDCIVRGWFYQAGLLGVDPGDSGGTSTVTLPITFLNDDFDVAVQPRGYKTSAPTSRDDRTGAFGFFVEVGSQTTTTFAVDWFSPHVIGDSFDPTDYYIVGFIAVGTI